MTKVVVSVSMETELAQELKSSAANSGESFSSLVCRLIAAGRDEVQASSDDDPGRLTGVGERQSSDDPERLQDQAAVQPQMPPGRSVEIESATEVGADEHRSNSLPNLAAKEPA